MRSAVSPHRREAILNHGLEGVPIEEGRVARRLGEVERVVRVPAILGRWWLRLVP